MMRSLPITLTFFSAPARFMERLLSGLILLAIFAFSTGFYQQFYIPKLMVFYGLAVASLIYLAPRRQLLLPGTKALLFMATFLIVGATLGLHSAAPRMAFMQWSFYFGGALLFVALLNFGHAAINTLLKMLFAAALIQLVLVIAQILPLPDWLPPALMGHDEPLFGTLGNQEFLSTLLGVGFFLGLHFHGHTDDRRTRLLLIAASTALLLGLVLAQNKGALLFIGLYFLWKRLPGYKLILALGVVALLAAVFFFPASIKGRMLLWLVAATMFLQHFALGVGFLQFENHYLDVVRELFSAHPALSEMLGSHTAMAMDTHNIFLQFAVALGVTGLLLSLAFAGYVLRLATASRDLVGVALLFLLYKCLYTVVLSSVTGMIVLVILLAALARRQSAEFTARARPAAALLALFAALPFLAAAFLATSDYFYQQGARSLFMGQNAQAAETLKRALSVNRENSDAHLALAQARYLQGDYERMRNHIEDALLYRKNKDTCKIAAYMFYRARRYDDAFSLYQFLHATFPQHLTSLTKLASIYMLRGEYDNAYAMAQRALRAAPRKHAESDARNIRLARQIMADSYPFISQSLKSNLREEP